MSLSIDDAVKTVLSFDNLVREGMTTSEQIGFLIDNHAQLDEDYSIGGEKRTVLLPHSNIRANSIRAAKKRIPRPPPLNISSAGQIMSNRLMAKPVGRARRYHPNAVSRVSGR